MYSLMYMYIDHIEKKHNYINTYMNLWNLFYIDYILFALFFNNNTELLDVSILSTTNAGYYLIGLFFLIHTTGIFLLNLTDQKERKEIKIEK